MKKNIQLGTCIVFCGFIALFTILNFMNPDKVFSENENRFLTKKPEFSTKTLFDGSYTEKFEKYITDQFVFRDQWITIKAAAKLASGSIENNDVYFGKNDQLIQKFSISDTSNLDFSIKQINKFINNINIPFDVMIVPTASEINKNELPLLSYNEGQRIILEKIKNELNGNWIDLYEPFLNEKNLYFKTDHHWNEKGAYLAYQEYMKALGQNAEEFTFEKVSDDFKGTLYSKSGAFWMNGDPFYKMVPKNKIDSMVTFEDGNEINSLFVDKRLEEKDKYTYYIDGNHSIVKIKNEGVQNSLGKLLIIKDSYGHILAPYLASNYEEIIMLDLRYYRLPLSKVIEENGITNVLMVYNLENIMTDKNTTFLK